MISDTLFDVLEIPLDSGNTNVHRTRTGRSGNPLMTIVDCQGVFEMEVLFCVCSDARSKDEQVLKAGLFPATFKQIETLFTFSVLDNFLTDNLECKTNAQQYYSKLQSMTSSMFPDHVPVGPTDTLIFHFDQSSQNRYKQLLRASRQWRDLKNRIKSGLGHSSDQECVQDGSMAVFCPACPQPGVNLPENWKEKYTPYVRISGPNSSNAHPHKGINWSEPSSWTETFPQSICAIGQQRRTSPYPLEWHSWPIQIRTSHTSEAELRYFRQVEIHSYIVRANILIAQYM
jgi:hypothetical protein